MEANRHAFRSSLLIKNATCKGEATDASERVMMMIIKSYSSSHGVINSPLAPLPSFRISNGRLAGGYRCPVDRDRCHEKVKGKKYKTTRRPNCLPATRSRSGGSFINFKSEDTRQRDLCWSDRTHLWTHPIVTALEAISEWLFGQGTVRSEIRAELKRSVRGCDQPPERKDLVTKTRVI